MKKTIHIAAFVALSILLTAPMASANGSAKKSHKKADCASCCCDMKSGTKGKEAKASPTTSGSGNAKKNSDKK